MKLRMVLFAGIVFASACSPSQVEDATKSADVVLGDTAIVAQITTRLIGIDGDSALHVAVASRDGDVSLSGRAKSAVVAQRFLAAAKSVSGVKGVRSTIVVDAKLKPVTEEARDAAIVTGVTGALIGEAGVNAVDVKVHAHRGAVTLDGSVKTQALKSTISDAAKHAPGVKSVVDDLSVKP